MKCNSVVDVFELHSLNVPIANATPDNLATLFPRPPFNPDPGYSLPHPPVAVPAIPPVVATSRPPFVPPLHPFPPGSVDSYGAPLAPAVTSRSVCR